MKEKTFTKTKFKWFSVLLLAGLLLQMNSFAVTTITTSLSGPCNIASNWDLNRLPVATDKVVINKFMTAPSNITCAALSILSGGRLTVSGGVSITVSGLLTLTGSGIELLTTSSSTSSLIFSSITGTGNLYYLRNMSGTNGGSTKYWHTISAPGNNCYAGTFPLDMNSAGNLYAFADYDESINKWSYKSDIGVTLTVGKGYTIAPSETGEVSMTVKPVTGSVSIGINHSTGATEPYGGWGWNAIGNPYTSAINVSSFYSSNSSKLDPIYGGLYVWDAAAQSYSVLSNVTGNYIQIGQGFVVRSNNGGGTIDFSYSMREHSTGTVFKSANITNTSPSSENTVVSSIELKAVSGKIARKTSFVFAPEMTTGLDPYCDAGLLPSGGGMDIYSRFIEDKGINFGLQALPVTGFNELVIPVLIDLAAAGDVTFTPELANLPSGYGVALEDRFTGATTSLTQDNSSYTVNLPANTVGLKRLYLHVSNLSTGSINQPNQVKLNVFANGKAINILGNIMPQSKAYVYNLAGSRVAVYNLDASGTNVISADKINSGMYLIQIIEGNKQKFTGKIILN